MLYSKDEAGNEMEAAQKGDKRKEKREKKNTANIAIESAVKGNHLSKICSLPQRTVLVRHQKCHSLEFVNTSMEGVAVKHQKLHRVKGAIWLIHKSCCIPF